MSAISFRAKQVRLARAAACDQLQGVALRASRSKIVSRERRIPSSRVIYALEAAKGRKDNLETR